MTGFVVGLTGGIGSGKTVASDYLVSLGVSVYDADLVAREIVKPDQPAFSQIVEHFGRDVVRRDGTLDRATLRKLVFQSAKERNWLEQLLHPQINSILEKSLDNDTGAYAILASPLIFETSQREMVDRVLLIDVDETTQIERTTSRDGSDASLVKNIINAQMSRKERLNLADDVVENSGTLEKLYLRLSQLHQRYLELAELD